MISIVLFILVVVLCILCIHLSQKEAFWHSLCEKTQEEKNKLIDENNSLTIQKARLDSNLKKAHHIVDDLMNANKEKQDYFSYRGHLYAVQYVTRYCGVDELPSIKIDGLEVDNMGEFKR